MPNARQIESTTGSFPFEKKFATTDSAGKIKITVQTDINSIDNIYSIDSRDSINSI